MLSATSHSIVNNSSSSSYSYVKETNEVNRDSDRILKWFLQRHLRLSERILANAYFRKYENPIFADIISNTLLTQKRKDAIYQIHESELAAGFTLPSILTRAEIELKIGRPLPNSFPIALRAQGCASLLWRPKVAIIGARHPTFYGREQAYRFAKEISEAGCLVISGGAIGIDTVVNETAFKYGASASVLGGGLKSLYPASNEGLFCQMRNSQNGLLISEFADDMRPQKWSFPQRNHTLALLADFLLVVEATCTSGSLITANAALDCGVDLGAIPGPVNSPLSAGTHSLLRSGAFCIHEPQDVLERTLSLAQIRKSILNQKAKI